MNKEQTLYVLGNGLNEYGDVFHYGIGAFAAFMGAGIFSLPVFLYGGYFGLGRLCAPYLRSQRTSNHLLDTSEIVFKDLNGLEGLLDRTWQGGSKEWGTVHKAHNENEKAVIHSILNPEDAIEAGAIRSANKSTVICNPARIKELGYNGLHHFHPGGGSMNFSVNLIDRAKPAEWINLLTFNMPYGPEIIGFNLNHTYIPAKREDKTRLIRAKRRDIWRYLGTQ